MLFFLSLQISQTKEKTVTEEFPLSMVLAVKVHLNMYMYP